MPKPWDERMIMSKVHAIINDMYEKDPTPWDAYIKSQENPQNNDFHDNISSNKDTDADIRTEIDSILNEEEF